MDEIGDGLSLIGILAFVAFLIWNADHGKQEKRRQRNAERNKLLAQIGSGEALTSFLRTEEGKKLLGDLDDPEKKEQNPNNIRMSIIGLLTGGVITLIVGAAFFYAAPRVEDNLIIPGGIIGGAGLGCIIAALIHYVLGKAWGMLESDEDQDKPRRRLE
jgi:hypothetical protein